MIRTSLVIASTTAVAVFFVASVVMLLVHRMRETRRARRVSSRYGPLVPDAAVLALGRGATALVEGRLRIGAPRGAVVTFLPYGVSTDDVSKHARTAVSKESDSVWLDLDGGSIALEPPLQVLIGSVETNARGDALRDAARLAIPCPVSAGEPAAGALRALRNGDRVRAAGRIDVASVDPETPGAADNAQGGTYRAPRTMLRLRPLEDESWASRPLPVFLAQPAPFRFRARSLGASLAIALVAAAGLKPVGEALIEQRAVRARIARATCAAQRDQLLHANDPWNAAALGCKDPESAARAHFVLGRFEDASNDWLAARELEPSLEPSVSEVQAHSLAHRPREARDVVRTMVQRWYPAAASEEGQALSCIMHGFGRAAGDDTSTAALEAAVHSWPHSPVCDIVAGDYGYRIGTTGGWRREEEFASLFSAERFGGSGGGVFHDPYAVVQAPGAFFALRPLALERARLRDGLRTTPPEAIEWDHDKTGFGHHAAQLAALYAVMGQPQRAAETLDVLDQIARSDPPYPTNRAEYPDSMRENEFRWEQVLAVAAGAAFEMGDTARARRYLPRAEAHTRAVIEHHIKLIEVAESDSAFGDPQWGPLWFPDLEPLSAAKSGDGKLVVEALERTKSNGRPVFRALVARVKTNRQALDHWAKTSLAEPCATCGVDAIAGNVSDRLEIARVLGDEARATKLREVASRHLDALLERDGSPERLELARTVASIKQRAGGR